MNTRFEFEDTSDNRIVYVRPVLVADLPKDIRDHAGDVEQIYAVHNSDGERLALVKDRRLAFILAEQNQLSAVNVH